MGWSSKQLKHEQPPMAPWHHHHFGIEPASHFFYLNKSFQGSWMRISEFGVFSGVWCGKIKEKIHIFGPAADRWVKSAEIVFIRPEKVGWLPPARHFFEW